MTFRVKTVIFCQNCHFLSKPSPPGQYGSNHVDRGKKWVFMTFQVKTVIFYQNRVPRVNTGHTMLTRVKNEFLWRFGSKSSFSVKTVILDQSRVHRVNTGQTMSTGVKNEFLGCFGSKPLFFGQNPVHRVDTHQIFFFCVFQYLFIFAVETGFF